MDEMRQPGGAAREPGFVPARIQQRGGNLLFTLAHFTTRASHFTNTRFPRRRFCPIISGASQSSSGLAFSADAFGFRAAKPRALRRNYTDPVLHDSSVLPDFVARCFPFRQDAIDPPLLDFRKHAGAARSRAHRRNPGCA